MTEPSWPLIPAVLLMVAALAAWTALDFRRRWKRRSMRRRFRRGRAGEERAEALLRRHGYEILDGQLRRPTGLWIDGQWEEVTVRADFLALRQGQTFVVEVKTGSLAPDPRSTATRRQLLEYRHVYQTDGLLLADMETERLHQIRFPEPGRQSAAAFGRFGWPALIVCGLAGMAAGWLLAAGWLWTP